MKGKFKIGQVVMLVKSDFGVAQPALFRYHVGTDKGVVDFAGAGLELKLKQIRPLTRRERGKL
jgi:hypothetical protein